MVPAFYECAVFESLRAGLRQKDIWAIGADKWRDPDQDLPAHFGQRRAENYAALGKPLDPAAFIEPFKAELAGELAALDDMLPRLPFLDIAERPGGAIKLTPLDALPEPGSLRRLKPAITRRTHVLPYGEVHLDLGKRLALGTTALPAASSPGPEDIP
ncbi:MAG: transposase [Streptosporangiaceae bacterium]|nr:transposase [Streptosporangiaceae bacterium]